MGKKDDFEKKLILGFMIVFLMTYSVVLAIFSVEGNDYNSHSKWALEISGSNIWEYLQNKISYPLWHIMVRACTGILDVGMSTAVALSTALLNGFAYFAVVIVYKLL